MLTRALCSLVAVLALSCEAPPFPVVGGQSPPPPSPPPSAGAPTAAGRLTLPETKVDIGDVNRGDWASYVFVLKNTSDAVVNVTNVRGS